MNKTVRIGTKRTFGGRAYSVFCKIKFVDGNLSISGVEGPLPSGNCLGSCGQILDHIDPIETFAPGWTQDLLDKFVKTWETWHLNDMQAGCQHQRAENWGNEKIGEPCPVCGYKYGTAWLKMEVPSEVIEFLESLPETDKTPAWV